MSGFMKTVLNTESSVFFQSPIFFVYVIILPLLRQQIVILT